MRSNLKIPGAGVPPWNLPFGHRMRGLTGARRAGFRTVVYLHEEASPSTFRYRAYNPCQYLENSESWRGYFFFRRELGWLLDDLDLADLIVVVRYPWTEELAEVLRSADRRKIPVLFDIDDLVFAPERVEQMANATGKDLTVPKDRDFLFAEAARFDAVGRMAQGLIATNSALGKVMTEHFGIQTHILRNGFNREQLGVSNTLFEERSDAFGSGMESVTMGYFSGSSTHSRDFEELSLDLLRFMERHPETNLLIVGFVEVDNRFESLIELGRVVRYPLQDYLALQGLIAEVDLVLVPLLDGLFSRCKSELKYFEPALVRTPGLFTANPMYQQLVVDSTNGFLCQSGNWLFDLERVWAQRETLGGVGKVAFEHAMARYGWEALLPELEKILENYGGSA